MVYKYSSANHFGVSESDLKKVLTAALEKGGDYADLFFEHTYNNYIPRRRKWKLLSVQIGDQQLRVLPSFNVKRTILENS